MKDETTTVESLRSKTHQPLQQYAPTPPVPVVRNQGIFDFHDTTVMDRAIDMAQKLCRSTMVPAEYRRKSETDQSAIANTLVALDLADRMGANPLMVMQNLNVIKGKPSWSGQYIIAAINQSGRFAEPLHFEFFGDEGQLSYGCYAETTTHSGKVIRGPKIDMQLAKNEGWMTNPKWTNMPDLMLRYRAGAWFGKTECPELLMGISNSSEELDDMSYIKPEETDIVIDKETGEVLDKETPVKFVDMKANFKTPVVTATVTGHPPADLNPSPGIKKTTAKQEEKAPPAETAKAKPETEEAKPEMTHAKPHTLNHTLNTVRTSLIAT